MHNYKFYEVKEQGTRVKNSKGTCMVLFHVGSGKYLEHVQSMYVSACVLVGLVYEADS